MKKTLSRLFFFILCSSQLWGEILTFSRAYELALQNDHALKSAQYQVESGAEKVNQVKASLYPQVDFSAYYSKAEYKYNPDFGGNMVRQGLYSYGLSLSQTLYNPVLFANIKVQKIQQSIYKEKLSLQKIALAQKTFQAYLELLKSNNKVELLQSYKRVQESKLKEARKKYTMNLVSRVDMLQAKVDFESIEIDLQKEKKHYKVALLKLKSIIGNKSFELPVIHINDKILENIDNMKNFIVNNKQNFQNNLEIKIAQNGTKLAVKKINQATAEHYPSVDLSANFIRYGTDTPTIDYSYDYTDRVMVTVNIPLFSGWATSSKISEAKLLKKAAVEDLYSAQEKAVVDRDEYFSKFETAIDSLAMYHRAFQSATVYVEAMDESFKHGLKSIIDVNEANSKLYEVKYKYIDNINELVDAYINLLIIMNNFEGMKYLDNILELNYKNHI